VSEPISNTTRDRYLVGLLESFPMGVVAVNGEGRIEAANSAMSELLEAGEGAGTLEGGFGEAVRCINAVRGPEG
jgi:hypothetical protein